MYTSVGNWFPPEEDERQVWRAELLRQIHEAKGTVRDLFSDVANLQDTLLVEPPPRRADEDFETSLADELKVKEKLLII